MRPHKTDILRLRLSKELRSFLRSEAHLRDTTIHAVAINLLLDARRAAHESRLANIKEA